MGVWRRRFEEFGEDRAVELLRDHGLAPSSLSWAGGFTGERGTTLREARWDAAVALDWAAELGAPYLLVVTGPRAGHCKGHLRKLLIEEFRKLGDFAESRNVTVLLHALSRPAAVRWSCLTSVLDGIELLTECAHSRLGLAVDLNSLIREPAALARIDEVARWTRLAVIRDIPRIDLDPLRPRDLNRPPTLHQVIDRLEHAGFTGRYELHLPHSAVAPNHYETVLRTCVGRLAGCLQAGTTSLQGDGVLSTVGPQRNASAG